MTRHRDQLAALGRDVGDALPEVSDQQRQDQREAVRRHVSPGGAKRRTGVVVAAIGGVAAAAAFVLWFALPRDPGFASTPDASDGSDLPSAVAARPESTPEPRAEQPETKPDDVVVLEEGSLALGSGDAQQVRAGPYAVHVSEGAACSVSWDPEAEQIDVVTRAGVVVVHTATSQHTVVAGDRVRGTPAGVVVTSTRAVDTADGGASPASQDPLWRQLAQRGRYRQAMAIVSEGRLLDRLEKLGRRDLKVLADVTRLGGAPAKSTEVLQTLRERFPRSREARRAAFYLGRHAERSGRSAEAIDWYREYLRAGKRGSLVGEVRGRLLTVLAKQKRHREAREVALEYLEHHPDGPHATAAARIAHAKGR